MNLTRTRAHKVPCPLGKFPQPRHQPFRFFREPGGLRGGMVAVCRLVGRSGGGAEGFGATRLAPAVRLRPRLSPPGRFSRRRRSHPVCGATGSRACQALAGIQARRKERGSSPTSGVAPFHFVSLTFPGPELYSRKPSTRLVKGGEY